MADSCSECHEVVAAQIEAGAGLHGTLGDRAQSCAECHTLGRVLAQRRDEKEWKPMSMGTISLPKGKGTLTLQAAEIPGASVMDFRLLMFKRK